MCISFYLFSCNNKLLNIIWFQISTWIQISKTLGGNQICPGKFCKAFHWALQCKTMVQSIYTVSCSDFIICLDTNTHILLFVGNNGLGNKACLWPQCSKSYIQLHCPYLQNILQSKFPGMCLYVGYKVMN